MSGYLNLNGIWNLAYTEDNPDYYKASELHGRQLLAAKTPAPIHQVLMEAGWIEDVNIGMNSLKARWVEECFWIYRRTFTLPEQALNQSAWLTFAKLELNSVILLNGQIVGVHANAHRPARFEITDQLCEGENLLVVQIESGVYSSLDKPGSEYAQDWFARFTKRPWHRKPQYQCGWDWNPRLMNVGILGDVSLEWGKSPRLNQVTVFAVPSSDLKSATLHIRATVEGLSDLDHGTLRCRLVETGQEATLPLALTKGESRHEAIIEIVNPQLWWPIHHGGQHLYTVEVTLDAGEEIQTITRRTGVRKIEMDQSPHPVEGSYCILKINNRPIFCKGGNWVPADMLYSTVGEERTRELVSLALKANFNLLRIWGGGLFADQALCDACDEAGALIWHDFLFACAKYPGDHPEFAAEVRREVTCAVREMAHHPSLAVWCGNNEIEWGDWEWGYDNQLRTHPHYALFHHDIPKIVLQEDPSTLHWISSPWSPDYKHPNDATAGDQHPWEVSIFDPNGADFWKYRFNKDRFPNEGGVLGASSPATLRQFLPENERYILSPSWHHHDNPLAHTSGVPGKLGRAYQTLELWLGLDALKMGWQEYAFASGLLQAEGLMEYILNYRRRMFHSASAIFWMYNDSWPVTHGWTIVDYYLRKKLAYHPVRRAFQPVTVAAVEEEGIVTIYGVNDTPEDWLGEAHYGVFLLAGGAPLEERIACRIPANASTPLASFSKTLWEQYGLRNSGAFATLSREGEQIAQHRLFVERFKDLDLSIEPVIGQSVHNSVLTLQSNVFVWGLCLDVEGEAPLADNCFDLLPGIPYSLHWPSSLGEPKVVNFGNRL